MLRIGDVLDRRYRILKELGHGGESRVYLAEHISLHNNWAVKEVLKNGISRTGAKYGMAAESSILTKLRHPQLPAVVDIMETPDTFLIVMEYIEGISLDKVLKQNGAQSEENVYKWGRQLCDVLTYLHTRQPSIIFRDMKPSNIMLKPNGDVVLLDFGLAKEYTKWSQDSTRSLGTYGFAAPEQFTGARKCDERTDIYSLGMTLWNLLTAKDPTEMGDLRQESAGISMQMRGIIARCTAFEPENRYQTAAELKEALSLNNSRRVFVDNYENDELPKRNMAWLFALIPVFVILIAMIVVLSDPGSQERNYDEPQSELVAEEIVTISTVGDEQYYTFFAERTGLYQFFSRSSDNLLPMAALLDYDGEVIALDNSDGEYADFLITCELNAGSSYYLWTTLVDFEEGYNATGSYTIYTLFEEE